jgi:NAD(P)H-dependent flavin oxidoreductase YrpB (nitropropane dioxygenase family)
MATAFTELVGCAVPVQLAAMGGVGTTELASAVVAAGGLGMVPSPTQPAAGISGIGYLMPFTPAPDEIRETARGVRVVEFFYGDPRADFVTAVHEGGALAGWQVGSAAEAIAAEQFGCDYVIAQGIEAGGHVRGRQPLNEVLAQVLAAVRVPVLATGGIATAERVAELIGLGAAGVRVGTRFVATPESGAHPEYVEKLIGASAADTVITEWFGEGWEHAPHRVLRSSLEAAQKSGWRETMPPTKDVEEVADRAHYAGMGVSDVDRVQRAADVVRDLVRLL